MVKITKVSPFGFQVETEAGKWYNYDKNNYAGYKLQKIDEGKEIDMELNPAGYVTFLKILDDVAREYPKVVSVPNTQDVASANTGSLSVKVITTTEPDIFEDELNAFAKMKKVKFTQTNVLGNLLVAVVFYED